MNSFFYRVLEKLTPRRAAAAVLLYGLKMQFAARPYRHQRIYNKALYRGFFDAFFHPQRSAWVTICTPSEMLIALGLSPIMLEAVGGVIGSLGLTGRFLKNTLQIGIPASLCTFHRAHLSVVLNNGFFSPRLVMAVSALCDGNLRSFQEISELLKSPFVFLDIPLPESPGAESYLKDQPEESYYRLAGELGIRCPLERLKRTLSVAEETRKWILKVAEVRQDRYFPDLPLGLAWNITIHTSRLGSPKTVYFYKTLYRELVSAGEKIPQNKLRLLLMHLPPAYDHPALDIIRKKNAFFVMEEYNAVSWPKLDPGDPFASLSRKILSQPQIGKPDQRLAVINDLIGRYSAVGVINFSHWGCRQSAGSLNAFKRFIKKPLLNIETDLVDPDSSSSGQLSTRIEGFFEMVE